MEHTESRELRNQPSPSSFNGFNAGVALPTVGGKVRFEAFHLLAQNEVAILDDPGDGCITSLILEY